MNENFNNFLRAATKPESIGKKDSIVDYDYENKDLMGNARDKKSEIVELQKQKDAIMLRLKEQLKLLDTNRSSLYETMKGSPLRCAPDGAYYVRLESGKEKQVSAGDLMTDGIWGISYRPDATVSREFVKEYLIQQAKEEITDLYDSQIIKHEGYAKESGHSSHNDELKIRSKTEIEAFQRIDNITEKKDNKAGFIAEKMIRAYLTKYAIDNNCEYEIVRAPFDADMYYKVDFFVRLKKNARAVSTATIEKEDMNFRDAQRGIQFTINESPEVIQKKLKQINAVQVGLTKEDHIKDIVLVTFAQEDIMDAYNEWKDKGKQSGGPDKFLPRYAKSDIIANVLQGYVEENQLSEYVMGVWSETA